MSLATIGARLRNRFTKVGTALYDAGNTSTFKLPQGPLLRTLWLRLSGSLNVTTLGTVLSDAPLGLISKVELVADGDTKWAASPRDLYRFAQYLTSKAPELVAPSGTGAAVACSFAFPVHFEAHRRSNPADSLFNSEPYAQLELKITWAGALSAILTGHTATINATTSLTVTCEDTYEGHDQIGLIRKIGYVEKVVTAAQSDFEIALPKSGLLDCMLIRADVDSVSNDLLISDVKFQFDNSFEPIKSVPWYDLQNKGISDYSVDGGSAGTGRIPGYALVDLMENGMLTSAPQLKGMTDPKLLLTTTLPSGTTRIIRVTLITYDVIPGATA